MFRHTVVVVGASLAALLSGAAVSATTSPFPASEQDGSPPAYLPVGAALPISSNSADARYFEDAHMRAERGPLVDRPAGATRGSAAGTALRVELPTPTLSARDD